MSQEVHIPASEFHKMKRNIERLARQADLSNMISEKQAAELLGVKARTMQVWASQKKLEGLYTVSPVNRSRFYYKDKILGLVK